MAISLWHELRRRQMFRLTGLYVVGAWLVIQVADIVFPAWGIPDTALRYLFYAAFLCFPIALVFGWFFDLRKDGIYRTRKAGPDEIVETRLQKADYGILAALAAVGIIVLAGGVGRIQQEALDNSILPVKREKSIAVLPFDNLDTNPETGYFSDGVTEEILTRLSTLGMLHVIGRTSSFAFRNADESPSRISELLGVRYLLHGSVRRDSDQVRVTARLIDDSGYQVWTQSFDRKLEGIFAIQAEIASAVSTQILNEIVPLNERSPGSTTSNMDVYDAYLIAKSLFNARTPGWPQQAEEVLLKAIELEPDFAPAYALLSMTYSFGPGPGREIENEEKWRLARRALKLDPGLAEAHLAVGFRYRQDGDDQRAVEHYRMALEIDPTQAIGYGWLANATNDYDEKVAIQERGLEVDPLNQLLLVNQAMTHLWRAEHEQAERLLLRGVRVPEPARWMYGWLRFFYVSSGRIDQAIHWTREGFRANSAEFDRDVAYLAAAFVLQLAELYSQLGMFEQAEDWHSFGNSIYHDPINEFGFLAARLRRQGRLAELSSLLDSSGELLAQVEPEFATALRSEIGMAHVIVGQFDRGIELLEPEITFENFDPVDLRLSPFPDIYRMLHLAFAYSEISRSDEAVVLLTRVLEELERIDQIDMHEFPETFETMALARGLLGNLEGAIKALERGIEVGWTNYYLAIDDPLWAKAFGGFDLRKHLADVKAELAVQRAAVESADAANDFRAELGQVLAPILETVDSPSTVR